MPRNQQCAFSDDEHDTLCENCSRCICYGCAYETDDGAMICPDCHLALQNDQRAAAAQEDGDGN